MVYIQASKCARQKKPLWQVYQMINLSIFAFFTESV